MQTRDFVEACKRERDSMLAVYTASTDTCLVARLLREAGLDAEQRDKVHTALATALTDSFYTLLLALDGCASLGGLQQPYQLLDQDGSLISESEEGDLESLAYELFQTGEDGEEGQAQLELFARRSAAARNGPALR